MYVVNVAQIADKYQHAPEEISIEESVFVEHQSRDQGWQAAEAGGRHCLCGQAQSQAMNKKPRLICGFCERDNEHVILLIKSEHDEIYICNDCVMSAAELIAAVTTKQAGELTH